MDREGSSKPRRKEKSDRRGAKLWWSDLDSHQRSHVFGLNKVCLHSCKNGQSPKSVHEHLTSLAVRDVSSMPPQREGSGDWGV